MEAIDTRCVVHLELHTGDLPRACSFYARLLGCDFECVNLRGGSYVAMDLGGRVGGGIVECGASRPSWLPYFEIADVRAATARARELGASVLLEPREGPAGWRSVIAEPASGEMGLWQPKLGLPLRRPTPSSTDSRSQSNLDGQTIPWAPSPKERR